MKLKDLAKKAAIVHQYHTAPADLSVEKLIGYGRIPHRRTGSFKMSEKDVERVEWAMEVTRTEKSNPSGLKAVWGTKAAGVDCDGTRTGYRASAFR